MKSAKPRRPALVAPASRVVIRRDIACEIGRLSSRPLDHEAPWNATQLEIVLVNVPYPGADPDEVETGICQKIEEAVSPLAGIKEVTSIARENLGSVVIELQPTVSDVQKILNEIRSEVDRISTFPEQAEDPEVKQVTFRDTAIRLAVIGPDDDSEQAQLRLRDVAEETRASLLQTEAIAQAEIQGALEYEINVEVSEETMRRYGLNRARLVPTARGLQRLRFDHESQQRGVRETVFSVVGIDRVNSSVGQIDGSSAFMISSMESRSGQTSRAIHA